MEGGITGPTGGATCKAGNITVLVPDPELLNYGGGKCLSNKSVECGICAIKIV